jgi:hypothetical protein
VLIFSVCLNTVRFFLNEQEGLAPLLDDFGSNLVTMGMTDRVLEFTHVHIDAIFITIFHTSV